MLKLINVISALSEITATQKRLRRRWCKQPLKRPRLRVGEFSMLVEIHQPGNASAVTVVAVSIATTCSNISKGPVEWYRCNTEE